MNIISKIKVGLAQRVLDILNIEVEPVEEQHVDNNIGVPKKTLIQIQDEWVRDGLIR